MSSFFIIVRKTTLQEARLIMPPKFVSKNEKSLSKENIVLKVGKWDRWRLKLKKDGDGNVWFALKKSFENRYSIKDGHFLVFKYQGNSKFQVLIFNKTAMKIACPSNVNPQSNSDSDSDSVQILNASPVNRKTKKTHKGLKQRPTQRSENGNDKDTAIQRAEAFKFKNPFFRVVMSPSYISTCSYMNIPKEFSRNHIEEQSTEVVLENFEERNWRVRYVNVIIHGRSYGRFTFGWKKFVEDNNLEAGDVCLFELIRKTNKQVYFRVRIF